jgi:hypothetical protein
MARLRGVALAPAAAAWLADAAPARVLNVFERACNLIGPDGAVLALVTTERGLGPFAVLVESDDHAPFRGLSADSPVQNLPAEHALSVGKLHIEYGGARAWEARPDWAVVANHYCGTHTSLPQLAEIAAETGPAGSLLDLYRPTRDGTALARALLDVARPGAEALAGGLAAGDDVRVARGARSLAGLGGGLTPAGDDFIVGVLLAAWAGLYGPGAERRGAAAAEAAAPRTTTLSAAYLRAAARGECLAPWHDLFAAQRLGEAATRAAVAALVAIGHTSGADALAGFVAVHHALDGPSARPAGG